MFANVSEKLIKKGVFKDLSKNLVKANMEFLSKSYVSVIFFSTLVSFIIAIFASIFFFFFNVGVNFPFVTLANEDFLIRFLKVSWMLIIFPIITFLFAYVYPILEKGVTEKKISNELPFATINMAAISGSMLDPTRIFSIIVSTKEYPYLGKEFIKIINGVNILGYDLISILRNSAETSPSKKLSDLFNGIATIITTGGDLPKFFDERAKSLLFEYNLEKEKSTRSAETFMDIYISVVIAAPMILMLLLVVMQISGLGFSLTTGMITLIMVSGVTVINFVFLTFLYLKQANEG
jgi:flagellar protein FlaJ